MEIEFIERVICKNEDIDPKLLHTRIRKRFIVDARYIIMYFAYRYDQRVKNIAEYFNMSHCNVIHAYYVINNLRETDRDFFAKIERYKKELNVFNDCEDDRIISLKKRVIELKTDIDKVLDESKRLSVKLQNLAI